VPARQTESPAAVQSKGGDLTTMTQPRSHLLGRAAASLLSGLARHQNDYVIACKRRIRLCPACNHVRDFKSVALEALLR